jgi:putative addiction module component (TIGR02574 family)
MNTRVKELKEQALLLSPGEREQLAGEILHSLDSEQLTDIDKAWIAEAEKRYTEYKSGKRNPYYWEQRDK